MIGALIYMQQPEIEKIFANEKRRLGVMIGYIDENLHKTPKQGKDTNKKVVTFAPWQKQGLGPKWDTYMDQVFDNAKSKAAAYMELHLGNLKKEWTSPKKDNAYKADANDTQKEKDGKQRLKTIHKDMVTSINKAEEEWNKVKGWRKPPGW